MQAADAGLRAGGARPRSSARCGLRRPARGPRGFIRASLASHYPAIPGSGQPQGRPRLLGGARGRGAADARFRMGVGYPGGAGGD